MKLCEQLDALLKDHGAQNVLINLASCFFAQADIEACEGREQNEKPLLKTAIALETIAKRH